MHRQRDVLAGNNIALHRQRDVLAGNIIGGQQLHCNNYCKGNMEYWLATILHSQRDVLAVNNIA